MASREATCSCGQLRLSVEIPSGSSSAIASPAKDAPKVCSAFRLGSTRSGRYVRTLETADLGERQILC
jgi:hypothetical protein